MSRRTLSLLNPYAPHKEHTRCYRHTYKRERDGETNIGWRRRRKRSGGTNVVRRRVSRRGGAAVVEHTSLATAAE